MSIQSINPVNGSVVGEYKEDSPSEISAKITRVEETWKTYRDTSLAYRGERLLKLAGLLKEKKDSLSALIALEMGKPIAQGSAEILKCASVCEYYAENGKTFLADTPVKTDAVRSYISYQPLGIVLAVMPWNFPFWQVFRFLAPALMAGNCGVLKHASGVSGCALAIEKLVKEAGFEGEVLLALICNSKSIESVIANPLIKAVTLTGSTSAGRSIAAHAGKYLKKAVLELGGSDPYLVLEDADLPAAARICADARLINNGQSCIAAKRFIVVERVAKEFIQLFTARMQEKVTGDPFSPGTDLGPMARKDLRDELHQQVLHCIGQGAECVLGGQIPDTGGPHAFYQPTILTNVKKGMLAYDQEIFGYPIL